MAVSVLRLFEQGPVLRALGEVALSSLFPQQSTSIPALPAAWFEATLPPRSDVLVKSYIKNAGGDPAFYRGVLPAHMFPQWGFPLAARTLAGLPYPMTRVVNAGCRIEMNAPLDAHAKLHVKARLASVDDDGKRALLVQRIVTGTDKSPDAVVAEIRAYVPLAKSVGEKGANGKDAKIKGPPKARPTVPSDAREIAFFRVGRNAGRDFAKLTGDVNPIHWFAPAARAAGFKSCILHGFGTLARAIEALNKRVFAGDVGALAAVDVRFTRPLVLPAEVGVYITSDGGLWVGDAPLGGAYLEGRFETRGAKARSEDSTHG